MTTPRLVAWSPRTAALVPLKPLGVGGGQSVVYAVETDPALLAAAPVPGEDRAAYFAKVDALIGLKLSHPGFAVPVEKLLSPQDRSAPLAYSMRRLPGTPLETLFFAAEREALGLGWWGPDEFTEVAVLLAGLFSFSERHGFTQNDPHPGQYLVDVCPRTGRPRGVGRVDALAFGFWHKNVYHGCDKARWEYLAPELQRLGRRPAGLTGFEVPREADRFGLAAVVFEALTGCRHCDFAGGDPDPAGRVGRKEFAVLSMPPGASVPDEVAEAYFDLTAGVRVLFERAFLGDPLKRPAPAEWVRALRAVPSPTAAGLVRDIRAGVRVVVGRATRRVRRLASAGRGSALGAAGVAALAAAVWLLPAGRRPEPGPEPAGLSPLPAATRSGAKAPADLPPAVTTVTPGRPGPRPAGDIPPPPRRPRDPNAYKNLNR